MNEEASMSNKKKNDKKYEKIEDYLKNHFDVVAIIGIEGSPTCGVDLCLIEGQLSPESGFLIEEIRSELRAHDLDIPIVGFKGEGEPKDLEAIKRLIG